MALLEHLIDLPDGDDQFDTAGGQVHEEDAVAVRVRRVCVRAFDLAVFNDLAQPAHV